MNDGWIKTASGWVKSYTPPQTPVTARGTFPTPRVMRDAMDPLQSMTDGKTYDSKAALRAEYRRAGVIEIGTEKQETKRVVPESRDNGEIDRALSAVGL